MSAPACSRRWLDPIAALALSPSLYAVAQGAQVPQAPKSAAPVRQTRRPAPPPQSVTAATAFSIAPRSTCTPKRRPEIGGAGATATRARRWKPIRGAATGTRIHLADGRSGWTLRCPARQSDLGSTQYPHCSGRPQRAWRAASAVDAQPDAASAPAPEALPDDRILLQRPMGRRSRRSSPPSIPAGAPAVAVAATGKRGRCPIAGDCRQPGHREPTCVRSLQPEHAQRRRPFGEDWFFNLGVISDTLFEARKLPTPIAPIFSGSTGERPVRPRARKSTFAQNLIVSLSLLEGQHDVQPPELSCVSFRCLNYNGSKVEEVRALRIDPRSGARRTDHFAAIQSVRRLRVHIAWSISLRRHPGWDSAFISDFRGFLFQDQPVGFRFFGSREKRIDGSKPAWFRRIDKDTQRPERYRQALAETTCSWPISFARISWCRASRCRDCDSQHKPGNRRGVPHNTVFRFGPQFSATPPAAQVQRDLSRWSGDGHFGRWNTTASLY